MGVMDKLITYMKLNDSDEDEDYDDGYLDDGDDEEDVPAPRKSFGSKAAIRDNEDEDDEELPAPKRSVAARPTNPVSNKVMSMRSGMNSRKAPVGGGMEVCVIKPNSFEEAREITETLLKNRTIVMNLEGLDVDVAQRILDFTSGSCFAIGGNLQKISMYIFILTPASVDISGDFQEILGNFDATLHPGL